MNGSRLNWMANQTEWFIVNWMAYYQSGWQFTKWMDYFQIEWMTLDGKLQNEWITVKLNGLPNWMAHTANGILDYAQGAWDWLTGSSSWRTSCLYNSETYCSMCRGNFSPTCRMNCLNLRYLGCNKSAVTYLFLQEPIRTWTIWLRVSVRCCLALQPVKIVFIHLVIMHL